jgi:hypothetical protein
MFVSIFIEWAELYHSYEKDCPIDRRPLVVDPGTSPKWTVAKSNEDLNDYFIIFMYDIDNDEYYYMRYFTETNHYESQRFR